MILSVLVVGLLAIVIDNTVLNVALKTIADPAGGLGASQSQLEWAINSYTLVFAGLLFTFGVIGDRIGRKRMLMIGLALFGLGSLFSAYSHSPDQLIAARAMMGLGGAAVMPQTLSIISNVFEPAERARAIGIWASAVGIGVATGPVLGGVLLAHFWWGSVFLINVPVTVLGAAAAFFLVPESRNPQPGKIDYVGVLASVIGLVLLVYGIVQGGDTGSWIRADVLGPVAAGLVVLGLFAWYETRIAHPSLDVRLFRDRRLSASVGAIALVFFGMGGVYFFTSFYLQNVRGYSPLYAGLLAVPFAVGQFVMAPRSSTLVSRFGVRAVAGGGILLNALAIAGYATIGTSSPIWVLAVLFGIQGAGIGLVVPATTAAVMDVLPRERAGAGPDQHRAPARGGARRRRARLDPRRVLPLYAVPDARRAARRGAEHGQPVHLRHPGGRAAPRPGGPVPDRARELRVRRRDARHHAGRHGASARRRDSDRALAARPGAA